MGRGAIIVVERVAGRSTIKALFRTLIIVVSGWWSVISTWSRSQCHGAVAIYNQLLRGLLHRHNLIGGDGLEVLHNSTGPADFDQLRLRRRSQPEVSAFIACGNVTARGAHKRCLLLAIFGRQANLRSNAVAIAGGTDQVQREPVVQVVAHVTQNQRVAIVAIDSNVDRTVVVEVAECRATRRYGHTKNLARMH